MSAGGSLGMLDCIWEVTEGLVGVTWRGVRW